MAKFVRTIGMTDEVVYINTDQIDAFKPTEIDGKACVALQLSDGFTLNLPYSIEYFIQDLKKCHLR